VKFLPDERLYYHTEDCLQFLRELNYQSESPTQKTPERFHIYWFGDFSAKQAFTVKSFLATQDLENSELWLWLDVENGYSGSEDNPFLKPFLNYLNVKRFDPNIEARNTPLEKISDTYDDVSPASRSDFFRHVVLYKYGGVYVDMDTMFLRDMSLLLRNKKFDYEFCYCWSAHLNYGNSAVLRLRQESEIGHNLLVRCREVGSCHPREVLRFEENVDLDLLVLPCQFFDPLWSHNDGIDNYPMAPFRRFGDFFRGFGWTFRPKRNIRSYLDFCPGAFAYHWHNFWDAREREDSYFGLFNQGFDINLQDRLGIEPVPEISDM